ncbi:DUF4177 domain-containing protein [Antarcticimicrobium luteum]|uniref:DUF4177 domain-containing protein n=1 Tax=Antarcticimicrobium luteum TaxID=2547397 RepID=A0A4R5UVD1_9RHOB|nr:DUF4177 domain-containing protein [Antarcticimicrobium luteum]TDK43194.1 DUF4177 domain-containing protein [Antarcticimicrobium luteum]
MPRYEYKVVPAPAKGRKAKGVKSPEARFALSVESVLNEMGAQGWEYLRAELLPSDERSGLTGTAVHWRNVLVFRRPSEGAVEAFQPRLMAVPDPAAPGTPPAPGAPAIWPVDSAEPPLHDAAEAQEAEDAGVEDTEDDAEDDGTGGDGGKSGA